MYYYPMVVATPVYIPTAPLGPCVPYVPYMPAAPRVVPPTSFPVMPYAPTRPAPPSKTMEPPLGKSAEPPLGKTVSTSEPEKRAPKIVETRTSRTAATASGERCKVGFWNISENDVDLTVAGKTHKLAKGRAITLELDRQFSWSIGDQPVAQERVAEGKEFHEIILRK